MNKQAYENIVGLVLSKEAKSPIAEAPITGASSLISSTPSSLVADVLSSPINLSSAGSASSGIDIGSLKWNHLRRSTGSATQSILGMLFPHTYSLYYGWFGR